MREEVLEGKEETFEEWVSRVQGLSVALRDAAAQFEAGFLVHGKKDFPWIEWSDVVDAFNALKAAV